MKKNLIPYLTISLVFTFSLNAQEIDNTVDNLKENSIKLLNEKSINKVYSDLEVKGMIRTTTKKLDVSNYVSASEISFDKYQKVSLKDVFLETLSYSDLVKSSREKVIQSQLKLDDAIADYFPTLNLEYSYAKTRHYPGDNKQRYKFYNDRSYRLVMSQNLYSGGATHTFIESLRQSLLVERNKYKIAVQEELTKAIKAYFGVVFSKKAVEVNDRNMKQLQKILDIVTIKYDNGASSIGDLTSIKASVANAQTKLIKDKSKLNEALRYYEYVVGQKFSKTLPFERDFDIKLAQFDILYERAVKQNPNLKNYYFNIEAEKHKVRNAKTSFSPRVDLELSY
ncbi:TolC family protein [Malaciobacter mytili]|uniref:TolC family protein n=1 Tax=Malaciobacter mytili TaxID=603050 RepID=UPI003A8A404D